MAIALYQKSCNYKVVKRFIIVVFFVLLGIAGIVIYMNGTITPTGKQIVNNTSSPSLTMSASTNMSNCLPSDVKLIDIVSADVISYSVSSGYTIKKVTVEQKLTGLHASCNTNGKLVDNTGKEIIFYHLTGCWGNAPQNYQDILAKQRHELEQLIQHSTVIQMTCNPSGSPRS